MHDVMIDIDLNVVGEIGFGKLARKWTWTLVRQMFLLAKISAITESINQYDSLLHHRVCLYKHVIE